MRKRGLCRSAVPPSVSMRNIRIQYKNNNNMAYSSEKIIGSTIWKLLERTSSQIIALVVTIVLARILMPEEYGIIVILMVFINLANVIVDGGLNTALIQKKASDSTDFSTIFVFSIILAAIIYILLYIFAPSIARFYNNDHLVVVLRVLSIVIFPTSINAIQRAYISKNMLFSKLFYCGIGATIISGVVGILMALRGFGVWALVGQQIAYQFANVIIMWITIEWRPQFLFSYSRFKGLFDYGWKIFMTNFIIAVYEDIRSLIIGKVYQPSALAYFDRGKQFPNLIMSNINASLQTVLLPAFADVQDDRIRVKQMMKRSVELTNFFIFPLLILLMAAAKPFVLLVLTDKWIYSVPFIQIFCVAYLMMPIQNSNMSAIRALGYSGTTLKLEIIKKILEAIILVISFMINVYAVAWGIVVYNFLCIFINLYPCVQILNYGIMEQIRDMLPTVVISSITGVVVYVLSWLNFPPLFLLLIQIVIGLFLYLFLNFLFKTEGFRYIVSIINNHRSNNER